MEVFTTDRIRNVVLLGHGRAGKTSLVEAMAYLSGMTTRMGKISDGNTISDFDKEEIKRQFSIHTSVVPVIWDNTKINFLDTPGYFDFVGEVEEAVSAADAAIIVVSGKNGIEVGTKKAWDICEKYNLPRMIFVTEMDIDNASFRQVVEDLQQLYGKRIAPFHLPIRENEKFVGYINVVRKSAQRWNDNGEVVECEIPEYSQNNLGICTDALMEAVAETSEEFMERYFNGDEFSENEIRQALRVNVADASMVPVEIMEKALELLEILDVLADKGSRMAVSDVGVAVQFTRTALLGAVMNVYINTKSMKNREKAEEINQKAKRMIKIGTSQADEIYEKVLAQLI